MHAYTVIGKTRLDDIRVEHVKAIMDAATEQSAPEAEVVDRVGPQRRGRQWAARRHTRQPGSCEADKGGPPDKSLRRAPGDSRPVWVEHIAPRAFDVSDERRARSLFRCNATLIQIP